MRTNSARLGKDSIPQLGIMIRNTNREGGCFYQNFLLFVSLESFKLAASSFFLPGQGNSSLSGKMNSLSIRTLLQIDDINNKTVFQPRWPRSKEQAHPMLN
ncbi:hypothetical protein TWF225_009871 [Orbilia oligospora]|nr:hypothetical protein TWF751_008770 [Orbilia oligospora]KAF3173091.1 hypothetical protein TWF225_009871 [Orbilia oligospora]KAF3266351.1 hypothetical protein TWF128_010766 [Orbilia oligospora]KAF3291648.1 hypothetical protein TWF132_006636 [Orbilia oligospora]